ncbi:MAG TPA: hypothetical protein PKJ14_07380 [Candidatus Cloacimonadota bacterium]|nr:hypothetical protein [Candidatus Cloacimonadota bacterium]HQL15333.1 hypothetical protein [Candidatus Cloacimonadota bacterium]
MLDIHELCKEFFNSNPVFFNETDMICCFGHFISRKYEIDLRMEVANTIVNDLGNNYIRRSISYDMVFTYDNVAYFFEFKYKTQKGDVSIVESNLNFVYHFKNQVRININRYDVYYDLERCEKALNSPPSNYNSFSTKRAFVLLYSNHPNLWSNKGNNMSNDFTLNDGIKTKKQPRFDYSAYSTDFAKIKSVGKSRFEWDIKLINEYDVIWSDEIKYGFKYLLIEVRN